MRHRLSILMVAVGGIGSLYFTWALSRTTHPVVSFGLARPRPWPYPDPWLCALAAWYDARHPAPPNVIKIHGDLSRVRVSVGLMVVACVFWLAAGVGMRLSGHSGAG